MYHHPPHWDNITAPHGRPNLRSLFHFGHNQEGDHKVHMVTWWHWIKKKCLAGDLLLYMKFIPSTVTALRFSWWCCRRSRFCGMPHCNGLSGSWWYKGSWCLHCQGLNGLKVLLALLYLEDGGTAVLWKVFKVQNNAIFETIIYEDPCRGLGCLTNSPVSWSKNSVMGSCSPPLEVKAAPTQKAIHYLHMGQQPSKQKEL
jgi:hypothetical protein